MGKRTFIMLENNPESLDSLAHQLGLSNELSFYDVYSLYDPDLLAMIPRPVYALIAIIPLSYTWEKSRETEDDAKAEYAESGPDQPVQWFKQTITHGCGSIAMLHSVANGPARDKVLPNSELDKLLKEAVPLKMAERAQLLDDSDALYNAHQIAASLGDTEPLFREPDDNTGQHFVAFVRGKDGHLWELEGARKGPLDRGALGEDDDALSTKAIELGLGRLIEMEKTAGGDLRFSCVALAPSLGW